MGETRVDLLHLLEDLRDAYLGGLEETILTEVIANSLDSRAYEVALMTDSTRTMLTVNKGDFIRIGSRGATYLGYRKAIQQVVQRQLSDWGDARDAEEDMPSRQKRPLERDLERVLEDLSDLSPLLGTLVEHKKGGQKRLPLGGPGSVENAQMLMITGLVPSMVNE